VVATAPADGEQGVAVDAALQVVFADAMQPDVGEVELQPGGVLAFSDARWSTDRVAGLTLAVALPPGVAVSFTVRGAVTRAGVEVPETTVRFTTAASSTAPVLRSLSPAHGDDEVPTAAPVTLTFSLPMSTARGTIAIDNVPVPAAAQQWSTDGTQLTVTPTGTDGHWVAAARVELTVGDDFVSADGIPVQTAYHAWFSTRDDVAPTMVEQNIHDGDELSLFAAQLLILTFDETVVPGNIEVLADSELAQSRVAAVLAFVDESTNTHYIRFDGLTESTSYTVQLVGYADVAGNALAAPPLQFSTNSEQHHTAPVVVWTVPAEGNVVDADVTHIEIELSESVGNIGDQVSILTTDGVSSSQFSAPIEVRFDGRHITARLDGLPAGQRVSVFLGGWHSALGVPLNTLPTVGDGILDFTTRPDTVPPTVATSVPLNGARDVYPVDVDYDFVSFVGRTGTVHRKQLRVVFSEPMDTSVTAAPLRCIDCGDDEGGTAPLVLHGAWEGQSGFDRGRFVWSAIVDDGAWVDLASGSGAPLPSLRAMELDVSAFRDIAGNTMGENTAAVVAFSTGALDAELNHTCTHFLGRNPLHTVTASAPGSANGPAAGVPHDLNVVTLAADGDGFGGVVGHDPAAFCSTSFGRTTLYFNTADISLDVRTANSSLDVDVEPAAAACPEVIVTRARWFAPSEGLLAPLAVELSSTQQVLEYVAEGAEVLSCE
jgi:methionine-rich copper-binding protein CopC